MATESSESDTKVAFTEEDLDRFHRNAPAALARRGPAYAREEALSALQTILYGALPIVGLVAWGWSAPELFLFLLVGAWLGILTDATKVLMLRRRAEAFAAAAYEDWHVWVVAQALRDGSNRAEPSHINAKWDPIGGIFVDFAMGGISTLLIVVMLVAEAGLSPESLATRGVGIGLALLAVMKVGGAAMEIFHHRANDALRRERQGEWAEAQADSDRPVKATVGLRGVGLFLLVFVVAILTDEEHGMQEGAAWWAMLIVNSSVVLLGLVNLTGPLWLAGETRWLREYLREQGNN